MPIFRSFFLAILLLLSLGTILDDDKDGVTNFEKLLNAFSLKRNLRKVFDLSDAATRVKGVDAFRGINALALLVAHKSMAMAHNPYVNKVSFSEVRIQAFHDLTNISHWASNSKWISFETNERHWSRFKAKSCQSVTRRSCRFCLGIYPKIWNLIKTFYYYEQRSSRPN